MKNSVRKGSVRYIVFKEANTWYGVGLEFNIVEEANTPEAALFYLLEAIRGCVNSAKKVKGRMDFALNQKPEKEYEELWKTIHSSRNTSIPMRSPYPIYSYGTHELARAWGRSLTRTSTRKASSGLCPISWFASPKTKNAQEYNYSIRNP